MSFEINHKLEVVSSDDKTLLEIKQFLENKGAVNDFNTNNSFYFFTNINTFPILDQLSKQFPDSNSEYYLFSVPEDRANLTITIAKNGIKINHLIFDNIENKDINDLLYLMVHPDRVQYYSLKSSYSKADLQNKINTLDHIDPEFNYKRLMEIDIYYDIKNYNKIIDKYTLNNTSIHQHKTVLNLVEKMNISKETIIKDNYINQQFNSTTNISKLNFNVMANEKSNLEVLVEKCKYSAGVEIPTESIQEVLDTLKTGETAVVPHQDVNYKMGEKYNIDVNFYKVADDKVILSGINIENKAKPELSQFFSHKQGNLAISAKEGINLLEGRSVYKEQTVWENNKPTGEVKTAWYELDLDPSKKTENKQFQYQRYDGKGIDLPASLSLAGVNMYEGKEQNLGKLIASLEKGNIAKAYVRENGESKEINISFNPKYKNFNMNYTENGKICKANINENTVDYLRYNPEMVDRVIAKAKEPQLKELKAKIDGLGDEKLKNLSEKIDQKLTPEPEKKNSKRNMGVKV